MDNDIALLQLYFTPGLGARTLFKLLKRLISEQRSVSEFVKASHSEITDEYKIKPDIIAKLDEQLETAERTYEELNKNQIQLIYFGHPDYPGKLIEALNETSPPVLFVRGDTALLTKKAVGFCGSRDISETAYEVTERCASVLAKDGVNIISGFASGADSAAHLGALKAGGVTTMVLATGILQFQTKGELGHYLDESNHLILSEFYPEAAWQAHNAMVRNKTVCGLSDAVVLTASETKGGTFEAGKTCLELGLPLYVVKYNDSESMPEGNKHFLERGATPLKLDESNNPILDRVFDSLKNDRVFKRQLSMF